MIFTILQVDAIFQGATAGDIKINYVVTRLVLITNEEVEYFSAYLYKMAKNNNHGIVTHPHSRGSSWDV